MFKRLTKFFLLCLVLITSTSCSFSQENSTKTNNKEINITWLFPAKEPTQRSHIIYRKANDIIKKYYPNYNVTFLPVNKNEYFSKLDLYIALGNNIDIAWINDSDFSYRNNEKNIFFKSLDFTVNNYTPNLSKLLSDHQLSESAERYDLIPTVPKNSGIIPFLKIPKELFELFPTNEFELLINDKYINYEKMLNSIETYIHNTQSINTYNKGIDIYSLKKVLPYIGYSTLYSTNNMIGYDINDRNKTAVSITSLDSYKQLSKKIELWFEEGYINKDIEILSKNNLTKPEEYTLSAFWGYYHNNHIYPIFANDISDKYIYIPLSRLIHPCNDFSNGALFISSASNHTIECLKIIDLFFKDDELYNLLTFGEQNIDYTLEENIVKITDPRKYSMYTNIFPVSKNKYITISPQNITQTSFETLDPYPNTPLNLSTRAEEYFISYKTDYLENNHTYSLYIPKMDYIDLILSEYTEILND